MSNPWPLLGLATVGTLFWNAAQLEDYVAEDNPVRVTYFFVDQLDLGQLGFWRVSRS